MMARDTHQRKPSNFIEKLQKESTSMANGTEGKGTIFGEIAVNEEMDFKQF